MFENLIHCVEAREMERHVVFVLTKEDRARVSAVTYVILERLRCRTNLDGNLVWVEILILELLFATRVRGSQRLLLRIGGLLAGSSRSARLLRCRLLSCQKFVRIMASGAY